MSGWSISPLGRKFWHNFFFAPRKDFPACQLLNLPPVNQDVSQQDKVLIHCASTERENDSKKKEK
jgi:hypothetical protein